MSNAHGNIRILVDTNVLISALVFGGKPRQVMDLVAEDSVALVLAEEILTETRRIIASKFSSFIGDLEKAEKLFEIDAEWVRLGSVTVSVSRDPDDNKFIEAALLGGCQYIICGDKDLLDLQAYANITIVSPAEFLELFHHTNWGKQK